MPRKTAPKNKKDSSPYVFKSRKNYIPITLLDKIPWSPKQREIFELLADSDTKVVFLSGPAGSGKTIMAVYAALVELSKKKVSDIVYVRSVVESASQKLGYLPGSQEEKLSPYLMPLLDKLEELLPKEQAEGLLRNELVSGVPVNYLRGAHFSNKFLISDESQNKSFSELVTILTRIGEHSKFVFCGDPAQSDINGKSGFQPMMDAFDNPESQEKGIYVVKLDNEDIVRSQILKYIVEVLDKVK